MPISFTPRQAGAITYRNVDTCVVAGPGSGKTTVLVERYRELIELHGFEPHQILAITFTEKAAANMKAKLADQFRHDALRLREMESAYVSTIHGFCARLLRENAISAGIDPRFAVLDARESEDLQDRCLNDALDQLTAERREQALELIETLQSPRSLAADLKNAYDAIRSAGKTLSEVRAMPGPLEARTPAAEALRLTNCVRNWPPNLSRVQLEQKSDVLQWAEVLAAADPANLDSLREIIGQKVIDLRRVPQSEKPAMEQFRVDLEILVAGALDAATAHLRSIVFDVLERFESLYSERKTTIGALDFNDLERRCIELLRRDDTVRERVRRQFRQIMLDEFQDINEQQEELIRLIRADDVFFAVGDVNQSIYGFRHAQPRIFREYRRSVEEAGKHSAELIDNFRSRAEILRCVETVLNEAEGIEARELVEAGAFEHKRSPSVEVIRVFDEEKEEASAREARWIAHRILALNRDFRDFAVLCRNSDSMQPILEEFDRVRIPYVCGRRKSFLLSREGLDITALLQTLSNPRDGIALATVLRSTLVGIGDESLLHLRLTAGSLNGGLTTISDDPDKLSPFAPEDAEKLQRFAARLKRWRADVGIVPLDVLISRMLNECGFDWNENVEAFLQLARTRGGNRSLLEFLRELESIESAAGTESDLSDSDQGDCVQVMTAHAAKGLEFPVTIIAAMGDGTRRSSASLTFTPEYGIGIKWKDTASDKAANDKGIKDTWARANGDRLKTRETEEGNRLLYVAMTRAEDHLILSYSCGRQRPSNWAKFIEEQFGLAQRPPSTTPQIIGLPDFDISVIATAADPPASGILDRRDSAEVLQVSVPDAVGQYETSINVTSLAQFANCPRKYYIQRYIGWNNGRFTAFSPGDNESSTADDDRGEMSASELGSAVHELLAGKPGPHAAATQALAEVFLESDLGRRASAAANSAREWEFIAQIEDTLVRGSIDLWFEENGEYYIVDYKTDDIEPRDSDSRTVGYAPQLALYSIALAQAVGKQPKAAYLHYLRPDAVAEVKIDSQLLDHGRTLIAQLREAQRTLRFDLREGSHCRSCQYYRSMCPAGLARESFPPPQAASSPHFDSARQ